MFLGLAMALVFCAGLTSCSNDDDDEKGGNTNLVGVWTQQIDRVSVIGFKLGSDGKFGYDEWSVGESVSDFSNMRITINWSATDDVLTLTAPGVSEKVTWKYRLSEDGRTLYLSDHTGSQYYELSGTFTKQ